MILYIWRHPKPIAAQGICLGQTDMAVDQRKLKRLANQIQRFVKINQLPKRICVSPLQRSKKVGEILAKRGFECYVIPSLIEMNFGAWDGLAWSEINKADVDAWMNNFAHYPFNNSNGSERTTSYASNDNQSNRCMGESVTQFYNRINNWIAIQRDEMDAGAPIIAVGHAGWITAAKIIHAGQGVPQRPSDWPASVTYRELSVLTF